MASGVRLGTHRGALGQYAQRFAPAAKPVAERDRDGKDFSTSHVMLDIAQDPFMATVYRTALIVGFEEFFGRVRIFSDGLTLAKYCAKEWPSPKLDQIVADMVRRRGLN